MKSKSNFFVFFIIYIIFTIVGLEFLSRAYLWYTFKRPFFSNESRLFIFYPELRTVANTVITENDGYFDILLLDSSTLTSTFGTIPTVLKQKAGEYSGKKVRVHNVSALGHSVLDCLYKYEFLKNKQFDLVVFYGGINEIRANNCPPEFFKPDLTHYSWYTYVRMCRNWKGPDFFTLPFSYFYAAAIFKERHGPQTHVCMNKVQNPAWYVYGADVKTERVLNDILKQIVAEAKKRREPLMLMSAAYYIPVNYSLDKFKAHALDYDEHINPIEIWSTPLNFALGIDAHNRVIKQIAKENELIYIDQNQLIPHNSQYFNDVCHFTNKGSELFVNNMLSSVVTLIQKQGKL